MATYFEFAVGVHTWRGLAFSSEFSAQRCLCRAITSKLLVGSLALGFVLLGLGAAVGQETPTPATSADAALASERIASE